MDKSKLYSIREELHSIPEPAGSELKTAALIYSYLEQFNPDKIIRGVGGHGLIAIFKGNRPGRNLLFRCELDAVPGGDSAKHLCGHDGHMTIMLDLASELTSGNFSGSVSLLFQPAEENGSGASKVVEYMIKEHLSYDYAFALHNNPNYKESTLILTEGIYAPASVGLELLYKGKCSHAAWPEKAINPMSAIIETISSIEYIVSSKELFSDFVMATVVNVELGENNFGVTPGNGALRVTLRANQDFDLANLDRMIVERAGELASIAGSGLEINRYDYFPATLNSPYLNRIVSEIATNSGVSTIFSKEPSRGSDDFSHFRRVADTLFFDIGNGIGPDIHEPDYIFNDSIIKGASGLMLSVIRYFSQE